ncbi:flagellar basal body P-ring biosynthesis protein FlgA [Planctomycetes bacterium CA13]|uniref:Flagellar basal body P-ring biosynthesis protein FlgA n=2 Tax=Novipirellula herctigrandis TaxID=2527986 RepID=A0A5C5Z736_9BACT|nr:flagellar basal body P-ring biosynthesis protein FlgA [Planctomycetes bacterium CA13]
MMFLVGLFVAVVDASMVCAQSGAIIPVRSPSAANMTRTTAVSATIDEQTSWMFRMKQDVAIDTPIVRLSDVIVPLDPNMPGWARLARTAVGLVPVDGTAMKVDRERLARVIVQAEATPRDIRWVGAACSTVRYAATSKPKASSIEQTAYYSPTGQRRSPIDREFAERIVRWIEYAIQRDDRDLWERYEILIDPNQNAMHALEHARGVDQAIFVNGVKDGECPLRVVSRGLEGPIETVLVAQLTANPIAVVPVKMLRMGIRIRSADLTERPISPADWDDSFFSDASELIGTETKAHLRADAPIHRGSVGKPTLIRRGDLLEVRVINGAISVTTNAKAQGDGAESDLIEIETLEPRKRLVARVVRSGLVEIVTRAPRTN